MTIRRTGGLAHEHITEETIGAFFEVYNTLGYGFLEAVYKAALVMELKRRGLEVAREVSIKTYYKGVAIAWQRTDVLVERAVVVEVKAGPQLAPTAELQLYNYLTATRLEVGLLLHFGPKAKFYRLYSPNDQKANVSDSAKLQATTESKANALSEEPDQSE